MLLAFGKIEEALKGMERIGKENKGRKWRKFTEYEVYIEIELDK